MSDGESPLATKRPRGLGRGLSALMGEIALQTASPVSTDAGAIIPAGIKMVDIVGLRPLPNQPRKHFEENALAELAESIRARGILQPIIVRESRGEGHYEIIAGERRWRAAAIAQLHQVPVIVKDFDDKTALELAIVENIQREALTAWEEGDGYRRLIDDFDYTQETLARIVGKSRSHIANLMRLQNLPLRVHGWLTNGQLSMGHARALINATDPEGLAKQIIAKALSVRQAEALVRRASKGDTLPRASKMGSVRDADIQALERQLSDLLGLKTEIRNLGKGGSVTLHYSSLEQLDMICQRLSGERI
jgi:ParB family transcriptional regulator, chromosome partitioning protein